MSFAAGTKLGPYEIIALIGSGGMGEVYRARDTRLQRDVALKILAASFTNDPDRVHRFEQEARAVAALNHPNIVSIYDVGSTDSVHYIVSELLQGETLRQKITPAGMPARKAIELVIQLANGLAAAHELNIVHRDLKPENIFINRNGQLKILDFGLAKLGRQPAAKCHPDDSTISESEAGQVLGTIGYMSPEQVKGEPADQRSDIFSFGSILYEMLNGRRAFRRGTRAETMTAILNEDPPEFTADISGSIAPALERITRHCIEKQPAQRFQSAGDIAFALEFLPGVAQPAATAPTDRRVWVGLALAGVALLALVLAFGVWLRPGGGRSPELHRITFRRGTIWNARFMPDGNVVFGAAWEGRDVELFAAEQGSTESRALGLPTTDILAISSKGELAVSTGRHIVEGFESVGMLARAPSGGGAPRDIAEGIEYADWAPDGNSLAVVRRVGGKVTLEYPVGKVLYETAGWVSHPRVSPDGELVAFIDHPFSRDDAGEIAVVDQQGRKKKLAGQFSDALGLAWAPAGTEVWFTATRSGSSTSLRAVTLSGKERVVYLGTGTLILHDIFKDGRVLLSRDDLRAGMIGLAPAEHAERDLSWDDWTVPRDLSNDGKLVSFDETGDAGGATGAVYIRQSNGSPAVRLGEGAGPTLSPDGRWVLARSAALNHAILKLPTGAGESATIPTGDVQVQFAFFFPDGKHILELGSVSGNHALRLWVQDLNGGSPRAISPEGATVSYRTCISSDGNRVAAQDPEGKITLYPVSGGNTTVISSVQPGDVAVGWTPDGKSLLVGRREVPARVFTIDLASGERKLFKTLSPLDPTGLFGNNPPQFSGDLKSYVYTYVRNTSDLYVVDGLK